MVPPPKKNKKKFEPYCTCRKLTTDIYCMLKLLYIKTDRQQQKYKFKYDMQIAKNRDSISSSPSSSITIYDC